MADHTITIANTLVLLEPRPTLWGASGATTMTWGTDVWGAQSEDMIQDVGKLLANTLSLDSDITDAILSIIVSLSNTLSFSSDVTIELLTNGIWSYIFPGDVTNADSRITTTYTAGSAASTTYTTPSTPNTTWS